MAFIVLVVLTLAVLYAIATGLYNLVVALMPLFVTPAAPVAIPAAAAATWSAVALTVGPIVIWVLIMVFAITVLVLLGFTLGDVKNLAKGISTEIGETSLSIIDDVKKQYGVYN